MIIIIFGIIFCKRESMFVESSSTNIDSRLHKSFTTSKFFLKPGTHYVGVADCGIWGADLGGGVSVQVPGVERKVKIHEAPPMHCW